MKLIFFFFSGSGGNPIQVFTNYFSIKKAADWNILQYRVDFNPAEDDTKKKKILVKRNQNLKNYIFDGTMLFTVDRFAQDPLVFSVKVSKHSVESSEFFYYPSDST